MTFLIFLLIFCTIIGVAIFVAVFAMLYRLKCWLKKHPEDTAYFYDSY